MRCLQAVFLGRQSVWSAPVRVNITYASENECCVLKLACLLNTKNFAVELVI